MRPDPGACRKLVKRALAPAFHFRQTAARRAAWRSIDSGSTVTVRLSRQSQPSPRQTGGGPPGPATRPELLWRVPARCRRWRRCTGTVLSGLSACQSHADASVAVKIPSRSQIGLRAASTARSTVGSKAQALPRVELCLSLASEAGREPLRPPNIHQLLRKPEALWALSIAIPVKVSC